MGTGFRTTVFFTGCDMHPHCPGCFNSAVWDPKTGCEFTDDVVAKIIDVSAPAWCAGLSLLGGEPTASYNIEAAAKLAKRFHEAYPDKDVWAWSGRHIEEIKQLEHGLDFLEHIDVLIDGPFIQELKDLSLKWRGSSNQILWWHAPLGFWVDVTSNDSHRST